MRGRVSFRGLVLVLLAGLGGTGVLPQGSGETAGSEALWVAGVPGLTKVSDPSGERLLEIADLAEARAVAVDPRRATVWVWSGRALHAYGFDGAPVFSVPLALPAAEQAELAVRVEDGSVWLAAGADLWSVSSSGQKLRALRADGPVESLAIDPSGTLLWVGTRRSASAYDAVTGASIRTLATGNDLRDLDASRDGGTWIARKGALQRHGADGELLLSQPAGDLLHVAAAPDGGAWIATGKELTRVGPAGETLAGTRPFDGRGEIVDLVADPVDGSAWVAVHDAVARVSAAGQVTRASGLQAPLHVRDLALYSDVFPPEISISSPAPGALLATRTPAVELAFTDAGTGIDPASLDARVDGLPLACQPAESGASCSVPGPLADGEHTLTASVRDRAGNPSVPAAAEARFTVDATPPAIHLVRPTDGLVTGEREQTFAGSLGEPASLFLNGAPVTVNGLAFEHGPVILQEGSNSFVLTATDAAGNTGELALAVTFEPEEEPEDPLPPDPAQVATPLDPTVASDLAVDTAFLYSGADPIQTGVEPGAIDPRRASVVRGRVIDRDGEPLPGARVSILGHPELGSTLSRADGLFDLAVNGGGRLVLDFRKEGRLPAQRQVDAPWRDYVWAPDVALVPLDPEATVVASGSPEIQVARGGAVEDGDGARRATLLFPAGTGAEMVLADGSVQPLPSLTVRATEYTVGPNGPAAMPGPLPPTTGYTYAVELSADEALAAGAKRVSFTRPVIHYLENFLDFPVGSPVPTGFYDRDLAVWVPSDNGRIVRVLGVAGGLAELDVAGSGAPADGAALAVLGIDEAELRQLALLYSPGQSLWRVPIPHFTPWDHNWPFGPPDDAKEPEIPEPETDEPEDESCEQSGSIIECHNQVLGEEVPVTGTPFRLHYRSDRVPGRSGSRILKIPVSGDSVPASLKRMDLVIRVAGRKIEAALPAAAGQTYTFAWDGKDAYGRTVQGRVVAAIELGWVYDGVYREPGSRFASYGGAAVTGSRTRQEVTIWRQSGGVLGNWSARELGLGGWSLTPHHAYDPGRRMLYYGNGRRLSRRSLELIPHHLAGMPWGQGTAAEGVPAVSARLFGAYDIAVRPDGGFYVVDGPRIRHVDTRGIIRTIAGQLHAAGFTGDGGPAINALLQRPASLDLGVDGSLYIADSYEGCIRRIGPDGIIRTLAGRGTLQGEGVPASQALLTEPNNLAVGPDGSLYFSEWRLARVRRIGPDGLIWTVAGNGTAGFGGDGGPARQARLNLPTSLAVDGEGNLYIADSGNRRIRRVRTNGAIETVAGGGRSVFREGIAGIDLAVSSLGALAAGPDGGIFFGISPGRIVRLSPEGTLGSVTAKGIDFLSLSELEIGPGGEFVWTDGQNNQVGKLSPALPGAGADGFAVPSENGGELYFFDGRGRHLRTVETFTGALRFRFTYDAGGRLSGIVDASGNATTVERRADGSPSAIVSAHGQRTELGMDAAGYLARIANPKGEAFSYASSPDGLLLSQTDPRNGLSRFQYDTEGRLLRDDDPAGGYKTLSRQERADGYAVELTTAEGRSTTYAVDRPASGGGGGGGGEVWTTTMASGEVFRGETTAAGSNTSRSPDGTVTTVTEGTDPRFGNLTPFAASEVIRTPSGLTSRRQRIREASLTEAGNPLSLGLLKEYLIENGRISSTAYDASQRRLSSVSGEGRQRSAVLDELGRITTTSVAGLEPVSTTYDAGGRLSAISQGTGEQQRTYQLTYGTDGRLASVTDPLSRTFALEYDEAGQVVKQVLPGGRTIELAYDPSGNPVSLTPPGREAHGFTHTSGDRLEEYAPPSLGEGQVLTRYEHDLDGTLLQVLRPDGQSMDLEYDTGGRVSGFRFSRGRLDNEWDAAGRLAAIIAPGGQELRFTYDGSLPLRTTWSGPVSGTIEQAYDSDFRVKSQTIGGTPAVTFAYDQDSLLVRAGALTLTRDPANGLLKGTTLGKVATTQAYNGFGEVTSFEARVNAAPVLSIVYERDRLGRIVRREETLEGTTDAYLYDYDPAGRLVRVEKNGATLSAYEYDGNGNRLALNGETADYDAQDRLERFGDIGYTYTRNGELESKSQDGQGIAYEYDELGDLREVTLANGIRLEYVVDGLNRRVGKKVDGALVQGFLYRDRLEPVAELDGSGIVVSVFVYGSRPHVPDYLVKGGRTYRIVSDHLGSPRLVIDTGTGEVVQRMNYDELGKVVLDTNPRFQPFGFAGGLYDPHTGLVRFGARDYDPEVGRWTAKDPLRFAGGDSNLYAYALSDPINLIDPEGLIPQPPPGGPLPPGWNSFWEFRFPEGTSPSSPRWFDPKGGEWRWHGPDKWHPKGHWDHNPWEQWNSPWRNVPQDQCQPPKSLPKPTVPWWQKLPLKWPGPMPIVINPCLLAPTLCGKGMNA